MRIFTAFVLLLSVLAIVNTQSQMNGTSRTNSTICKSETAKSPNGVEYALKCGSCFNVTATITSWVDGYIIKLLYNLRCNTCLFSRPASTNKTCTISLNTGGEFLDDN